MPSSRIFICINFCISLSPMCFYGLTAKNSFVNRRDMSHMTLISMPTLHLTQISKFEPFPWNFQNTMIGFHLRKMYKFIYKQISPKCDYLGYFSLRTWLYFCIVFICGIATSAYYDVKELIRPSLFSPGHDFKKPNFWRVWSQISLEVFIHFRQDIYHSNRLVTGNLWKKNGDHVICTLKFFCKNI